MAGKSFPLGHVVATPAALELLEKCGVNPKQLLARHAYGDWGDLDEFDKQLNEQAYKDGDRLLSSYNLPAGKVWIITEWDRSVTTILLPSDY